MINKLLINQQHLASIALSELYKPSEIARDGIFRSTQLADSDFPHALSFCANRRYADIINKNPNISCVITTTDLVIYLKPRLGIVIAEDPELEFYRRHNELARSLKRHIPLVGIHSSATIHPSAFISDRSFIGGNTCIGPGARILGGVVIGADCIIGPNVVIGSDGLEYKLSDDRLLKVIHVGGVIISDRVEIMANSVVARDVFFGFTFIGKETKIGPLANIGHRAKIGEKCRIAGNANISGSVRIGNVVWLGPSSTISNGIAIGDRAYISIGSVVVKDVKPGQRVSGFFAVEHKKALKLNSYTRLK